MTERKKGLTFTTTPVSSCWVKSFISPHSKRVFKKFLISELEQVRHLSSSTGAASNSDTGIWAIDFADEFPGAEVIGTDVSPIQPSWIPPNLKFEIDDCTREWTYAENSIDYVHTRWLIGSIADWTALFKEAFKCLKPGGYLESHEPSSGFENQGEPLDQKSALAQWGKFFVKGGLKFGRPFTVFEEHIQRKAMEAAGFVDIEEREIINPVGNWPADAKTKEIAQFSEATFLEDPKGYIAFFAHALDWTTEEIEMYLLQFRRELKSSSHRAFYRHRVVWGKKPLV
ncbi:conserved hypothetical protein [Verticillium alfalfae VaMs.102]|uniref:TAM domain methyltransferase n=1 Tax=Verticillium alfalfae (strain VaMs.102 / ATCC MYA-4576 / FGSC 10136) TaxID=526221 RepID=C9SFC6_VERA1|nr:conserved hypothetical protein [Verticillium alfalfae VaMs.102]EEY17912.1 conserved hypothetical protein [Verticillium alfalfae VaMs.102]